MAELVGIICVTITLMFLHTTAHDIARSVNVKHSPVTTHARWIEPRVNGYSLESAQGYRQEFPKLPFLDQIFENYDRRAWPTLGSPLPTEVTVYVDVYDMGPLDSSNMASPFFSSL
ncbi:glycine receptor subunit beta-type 4-like [Ixodes scapularis]